MNRQPYHDISVHSIPQIDGGVRVVALDAEDSAAVARDPAMMDSVGALAILEISGDGERQWIRRVRDDYQPARDAIRDWIDHGYDGD